MSAKREQRVGLLLIVSVIGIIVLFSMLTSCSAVQHILPDHGRYFITVNDTCSRQDVVIDYHQDVFASKISLVYTDQEDTMTFCKLFRRDNNNTYSYDADTVVIGRGQILKIISNKTIVVDYRCH